MARAISMAYVTPSVVARRKSKTRRTWKKEYAKRFKAGDVLDATSQQYRFGGVHVADIELKEDPYLENIGDWAGREEELYEEEGFAFMEDTNIVPEHAPLLKLACGWVQSFETFYVVPFKTLKVDPDAERKYLMPVEIEKARNRLFKALSGGLRIKDVTPPEAYIRKVA